MKLWVHLLVLCLWWPARTNALVSPRAPASVDVLDQVLGFRSATICWQPPLNSGGVTGYNILAKQVGQQTARYLGNASATDRCTAVRGLEPATRYSFIVSSAGREPASSHPVGPWLFPATIPDAVTGLRPLSISQQQVSIGWTLPGGNPALISGVRLFHTANGSAVTRGLEQGPRSHIVIRRLMPATRYSFQVQVWNAIGPSPLSRSVSITTRGSTPPPVERVLASEPVCALAPNSAKSARGAWRCSTNVTWAGSGKYGKVAGSRVLGYRVWSQRGPAGEDSEEWRVITRKTNNTLNKVRGLTADLWIRFRVAAINGQGVGAHSEPSMWMKTKDSTPDRLALSPVVQMPEPDKATVSWDQPSGGAVYGYQISAQQGNYSCSADGVSDSLAKRGLLMRTTERGEEQAGDWKVQPELQWSSNNSHQPSAVKIKGWVYASVAAKYRLRYEWCGLGSRLMLARRVLTDSGLPALNQHCVNHTSVLSLPQGYHPVLMQLQCAPFDTSKSGRCSGIIKWAIAGARLATVPPYALAHTPPSPQSADSSGTLSAASCATDSLKGQPWLVVVNDSFSNGNSFQVRELTPLTSYRFKVAGFNPFGAAQMSEASKAAVTPELPPQSPHRAHCTHPKTKRLTPQQLLLQWTRPSGQAKPVGGYKVQLQSDIGGVLREEHSDFTRLRLDQLEPHSQYKFRVAAVGFEGLTKWSAVSPLCRTAPDKPAAPTGLKVAKWTAEGDVVVQWAAAAPHGAPVTHYSVQILKSDPISSDLGVPEVSTEPIVVAAPADVEAPVRLRLAELNSTERYQVSVTANSSFGVSAAATLLLVPPRGPSPVRSLHAAPIETASGAGTQLSWDAPQASSMLVRVTPSAAMPVDSMAALFVASDGVLKETANPSVESCAQADPHTLWSDESSDSEHGNACWKPAGPFKGGGDWACPVGCTKIGLAPWCGDDDDNAAPCRVAETVEVFADRQKKATGNNPQCDLSVAAEVTLPDMDPELITCAVSADELGCAGDKDAGALWISFKMKFGASDATNRKGGVYIGLKGALGGTEMQTEELSGIEWDDLKGGLIIKTASGSIDTIHDKALGRDLGAVAKSNFALEKATWTLSLSQNGTADVYLDQLLLRSDLAMPLTLQQAASDSNTPLPVQLGIYNYRSQLTVSDISFHRGTRPKFPPTPITRALAPVNAELEWNSQIGCSVLRADSMNVTVEDDEPAVIELTEQEPLSGLVLLSGTTLTMMLAVKMPDGSPESIEWQLGKEKVTVTQSSVVLSWRPAPANVTALRIPTGQWTVLAWVETGVVCQLWVDGTLALVFKNGKLPEWSDGTFAIRGLSSQQQQLDAVAVYRIALDKDAVQSASEALAARRSLHTGFAGVCGAGQAIDMTPLSSTIFSASHERGVGIAASVGEPDGPPWLSGQNAPAWIEIDFGSTKTLTLIKALLMQRKAGRAVHNVMLDGQFLHEWTSTGGAQWLQVVPTSGTEAQKVRVVTVQSPGEVGWYQIVLRGCPLVDRAVYEQQLPGTQSSVVLTELPAGTAYNATVIAANDAGESTPVHLGFRTPRLPAQPQAPKVEFPGSRFVGTVQLKWQAPQTDLDIIGYRILVQTQVVRLNDVQTMLPWRAKVVQTAGARTNTALTLPVYTPDRGVLLYQFAIQAISEVGHGNPSSWSEWVGKLSPSQLIATTLDPAAPAKDMAAGTVLDLALAHSELHNK